MENQSGNWSCRHMENVGSTQARFSMPHNILLLSFRIHKKNKGIGMSWKVNIIGKNKFRLNCSGRVTPMEEKRHFGASETLGLDSLALWQQWWGCYETYGKNNILRMAYDIYNISGWNRVSNRALMWVGESQWVPTQIGGRWKVRKGRTHRKSWAHTQIRIRLSLWMDL